jgi:hypothetical protein
MDKPLESAQMSRRSLLRVAALSSVGAAISFPTGSAVGEAPAAASVSGALRSAGVMTFGADYVLFVGDVAGAAIHAFALREKDLDSQSGVELGNFKNFEGRNLVTGLDQKLAALLGTTYDKIVVKDMVVHQASQQVFLSVERGRGVNAMPAIVKVNHGQLQVLELDRIPHSQTALPNQPDAKAMLEFNPQRVFAITDIKYYKGEIFVTGISNQRFASTLQRIAYPFNHHASTTTVEIWHPVHGEFETRAPIIRQQIKELGGVPYLFAVYGCTPLVRFPLSALTDGAHVRGDLIGQLGYGSNPLDMLTYTNPFDKKEYLMVTIDTRSASSVAVLDLASAPPEPTGGQIDFTLGGLGKTQGDLPVRADHFAILTDQFAVQVWRHPATGYRLDLSTLAMPYCFERKDGMSEMNWPGGPDPFHYAEHRNDIVREP